MGHHNSQDSFSLNSEQQIEALLKQIKVDAPPKDPLELGATGTYPDGKIADNDEGGIKFGVTIIAKRLIIDFGKPVRTIGFTKEEAVELANYLFEKARAI